MERAAQSNTEKRGGLALPSFLEKLFSQQAKNKSSAPLSFFRDVEIFKYNGYIDVRESGNYKGIHSLKTSTHLPIGHKFDD